MRSRNIRKQTAYWHQEVKIFQINLFNISSINIDKKDYEINMKVKNMSFSAHADAKGILQLIKHLQPKNVMLVHGEKVKVFNAIITFLNKKKMEFLSEIIKDYCQVPCLFPANFERVQIESSKYEIIEIKQKNFEINSKVKFFI